MTTQPEALRLADALDAWDGKLMMPKGWREQAAAELRRLHQITERDTALLRRALEALDREDRISKYPNNKVIRTDLRERLGEKT